MTSSAAATQTSFLLPVQCTMRWLPGNIIRCLLMHGWSLAHLVRRRVPRSSRPRAKRPAFHARHASILMVAESTPVAKHARRLRSPLRWREPLAAVDRTRSLLRISPHLEIGIFLCDWYSYVWCTVTIHRDVSLFIIASYRELEGSKRTLASGATYPECAYSRPRH